MPELIIPPARQEALQASLNEVIARPGWQQVADVYDLKLPEDTEARYAELNALSDLHWDRRGGKERQQAEPNEYLNALLAADDEVQQELAQRGHADKAPSKREKFEGGLKNLGLIGTRHMVPGEASMVVVPAAVITASMMRALHGQHKGHLAYVGSERPLSPAEKEQTALYNPAAAGHVFTEADAMWAIMDTLHPNRKRVQEATFQTGQSNHKIYKSGGRHIIWADVRTGKEGARANTRETFDYIGRLASADMLRSVTVATNDIYAGFMGVDAMHIFEGVYGAEETRVAGFTPADGVAMVAAAGFEAPQAKQRQPGAYVQELRSTLHSIEAARQTLGLVAA